MKLKYVGDNALYGLATGEQYEVDIFTKQSFIWLQVHAIGAIIPYRTPQAVAYNWEVAE